jgi:hypothetical protein
MLITLTLLHIIDDEEPCPSNREHAIPIGRGLESWKLETYLFPGAGSLLTNHHFEYNTCYALQCSTQKFSSRGNSQGFRKCFPIRASV